MATTFTQAQKAQIRHYLGYSLLRSQQNAALEGAITAAQDLAVASGGDDGALVDRVIATLGQLTTLDQQMVDSWPTLLASEAVGDVKIDAVRALAALRMDGRRLVTALAIALDTVPQADVYSSTMPRPGEWSFSPMLGR